MTAPTTARREIAGHELVRDAAIRLKRERREPGEGMSRGLSHD